MMYSQQLCFSLDIASNTLIIAADIWKVFKFDKDSTIKVIFNLVPC